MGIHQLNRFLQKNCRDAIYKISFAQLKGKTIVIDTSIYLYKYAKENSIIEGMYKMITVFKYFDITPIFIFDGKPPEEKYNILDSRRKKKKEAELKYHKRKSVLLKKGKSNEEINRDNTLNDYKNIFVRIYKEDIIAVKKLIQLFGLEYYTAINEADKLCASMVTSNKAWACMSEDMDLFVYGCPVILRYTSFINESCILYNYNSILKNLNMNAHTFTEMCIFTGTDYNKGYDNIYNIYKKINKYNTMNCANNLNDFVRSEYTFNIDNIESIKKLFAVSRNVDDIINYNESISEKQTFCLPQLKKYLSNYNFIFI